MQKGCDRVTPEQAIKVDNVSKVFRVEVIDREKKTGIFNKVPTKYIDNKVIDNISFTINKGEVVGVIGRNGSGKSTLLSLIARIMEPTSGTIQIFGKVASIMELGMGFHPDMTGRQNIYLKGELYGFSRHEIDQKIDKIIEYSGISNYIDNPVRTYSSGMSGRLAFSIMLNVESDVMLVDEVLSVGDTAFLTKAQQHFRQLSHSGKTVVIVSHNLNDLEQMCSRIIWIEDGKIRKDGAAKNVLAEYRLKMSEDPEIVLDLAMAGVAESQYKLALMYRDGSIFGQNAAMSAEWMKRAADQGHTMAQLEYGEILLSEGTNESTELANTYFQCAANKGNAEAKVRISMTYAQDSSIRQNLLRIMKEMASSKDPVMQFRCGDTFLKLAYTKEDREEAFRYFEQSASNGYVPAKFQLALMYRDGVGAPRNLEKMSEILDDACVTNHLPSLLLYADLLFSGTIIPKNEAKAFALYEKAAMLGNAKGQYQVATMLRDGIGCPMNMELSEKWFSTYSTNSVGLNLFWAAEFVKFNKGDPELAYTFFKESSKHGITGAIAGVISSDVYNDGKKEERHSSDLEQLKIIANSGNIDAIRRVANYYYSGIGTEIDYSLAFEWYNKASELGDSWSRLKLGEMYRDGKGAQQNLERAISFFNEASEGNIPLAASNIIMMYVAGLIHDKDQAIKAVENLKHMACSGNIDAIRRLGNLYYSGVFVNKSYNDAIDIFKIGVKFMDPWSLVRCGEMYRDGKGVDTDLNKAAQYFREASNLGFTPGMWSMYMLYSSGALIDESCPNWILKKLKTNAMCGDIDAIRKLASIYYDGQGVKQNYEEALHWYVLGAKMGDVPCKNRCIEMYRDGKGTKVNLELMYSWMLSL